MILLGTAKADKAEKIREFAHGRKLVVLSPSKFAFELPEAEFVDWPQIIKYQTFYRLLQEIDTNTVVVVNECLRTQNRNDLTLNCIRHYLAKTRNVLVFQWIPVIDTIADWMTLVDFETQSRFKGRPWDAQLMRAHCSIKADMRVPKFVPVQVETSARTREKYAKEREKLFASIGSRDPHTLPRNLLLVGGDDKAASVNNIPLIGRNNRHKFSDLASYKDDSITGVRTVFEPCHNFIDMLDFLTATEQTTVPMLTTDLPVDQWYLARYQEWSQRIENAYAAILE